LSICSSNVFWIALNRCGGLQGPAEFLQILSDKNCCFPETGGFGRRQESAAARARPTPGEWPSAGSPGRNKTGARLTGAVSRR
jgi:hypothetical protein